jgi:hypothetical protein
VATDSRRSIAAIRLFAPDPQREEPPSVNGVHLMPLPVENVDGTRERVGIDGTKTGSAVLELLMMNPGRGHLRLDQRGSSRCLPPSPAIWREAADDPIARDSLEGPLEPVRAPRLIQYRRR